MDTYGSSILVEYSADRSSFVSSFGMILFHSGVSFGQWFCGSRHENILSIRVHIRIDVELKRL